MVGKRCICSQSLYRRLSRKRVSMVFWALYTNPTEIWNRWAVCGTAYYADIKREVKISNIYCCFRSISSPLLLSQTKFISNRKQCSTKKVRKPSWANTSLSFVSFSFETNLDLKFQIFRQLQKWLSSVHQRLLDMKSWWQILKFWIGHLETIYLIHHTMDCNCEPKQIAFLFNYFQEKYFWRF